MGEKYFSTTTPYTMKFHKEGSWEDRVYANLTPTTYHMEVEMLFPKDPWLK